MNAGRDEGAVVPGADTAGAVASAPTLASLLHDDLVSWDVLERRYGSLLELVRVLLGVVPNCDRYLEIWPPGFRSYNVMVPNFLNLPAPIVGVGGAPGDVVGLGMYVASRVAECPYCTAHSCSFALRRGASAQKVAQALVADRTSFAPGELATVAVARALARVPSELTAAERDELLRAYGPKHAEWIVLGIVMMGFLNKFMNAIGVELEQPVASEVCTTLGSDWEPGAAGAQLDPALPPAAPPSADGLSTKLRVIPLLPSALRLDARWQRGVPGRWPAAGTFLRQRTGHDFPVLAHLQHRRAARAVATMLRDNLDPASSVIGLRAKVLAGAVFAEVVSDAALAGDMRALTATAAVPAAELQAGVAFARGSDEAITGLDATARALLLLSRAASPSPAEITADVVAALREAGVSAVAIVELVTWLSVLQMLHRLSAFYTTE